MEDHLILANGFTSFKTGYCTICSLPLRVNQIITRSCRYMPIAEDGAGNKAREHTLILGGIATSGVVLSTLREAADKDFALTVLSDACLDADPEVHRVLMEKVFPRQANVLTVDAWTDTLD
jgi:hypothetical protein